MSVPLIRTPTLENSDRPVYDMALPFNPNTLHLNAQAHGLSDEDAGIFAHLALKKLRDLHEQTGQPVSAEQIAEAIKQHAAEEHEKYRQEELKAQYLGFGMSIMENMESEGERYEYDWNGGGGDDDPTPLISVGEREASGAKRFKFIEDGLEEYFGGEDPYQQVARDIGALSLKHNGGDIITAICSYSELAVELGKHLSAKDVVNLYGANRAFHDAVNFHLLSSIRTWIAHQVPEAGRIFSFKLYRRHLVPDPTGRTWAELCNGSSTEMPLRLLREVRTIPGLKYYQLVYGRDRCCRDIVAVMARNGHLMPKTMHKTLLRLWLLMEVATTAQREAILRNTEMWTDYDLYNAQLLFVKLSMHFNDPIYGPNTHELLHLMMGQKGLYPLWQLLCRKRFTQLPEILELKARYDLLIPPDHWGGEFFDTRVHGVPFREVGVGHREGWGMGNRHLMRPDELVPVEAVIRGLELDKHLRHMVLWGYMDWETGQNVVPTEEDMYISDEEETLGQADTIHHWRRKHALKKRFDELTPAQQKEILDEDEDERLRAMAWCADEPDGYESPPENLKPVTTAPDPHGLDAELRRGYIVRQRPADQASEVPPLGDHDGWSSFVNQALMGLPPALGEEEALRAQAWQSYQTDEFEGEWDWSAWLAERNKARAAGKSGEEWSSGDEDDEGDGGDEDSMDGADDDGENSEAVTGCCGASCEHAETDIETDVETDIETNTETGAGMS